MQEPVWQWVYIFTSVFHRSIIHTITQLRVPTCPYSSLPPSALHIAVSLCSCLSSFITPPHSLLPVFTSLISLLFILPPCSSLPLVLSFSLFFFLSLLRALQLLSLVFLFFSLFLYPSSFLSSITVPLNPFSPSLTVLSLQSFLLLLPYPFSLPLFCPLSLLHIPSPVFLLSIPSFFTAFLSASSSSVPLYPSVISLPRLLCPSLCQLGHGELVQPGRRDLRPPRGEPESGFGPRAAPVPPGGQHPAGAEQEQPWRAYPHLAPWHHPALHHLPPQPSPHCSFP